MLFKPGEVTQGSLSCEIIRPMAKGRMAELYLAKLRGTEHKLMVKAAGKDTLWQSSLKQEAMLLETLRLHGIPELYEWVENENRSYYIMSHHDGITLQQYGKRYSGMPELLVKEIGQEICRILLYLHRREIPIIHNDIKPGNILLQGKKVILLDFGVAQLLGNTSRDAYFRGTPGYAAPECWQKEMKISPATDIFALGATLYALLEGKEPRQCFGRYLLSEENIHKKNRWQPVLDCCTALNPDHRYQNAAQLYKDLKKINC